MQFYEKCDHEQFGFMIKRSDQCTPKLNSAQIPTSTTFHYSTLG